MDALDALSTERPILSTRLGRDRSTSSVEATVDAVARARTLVSQLPILVRGTWSPAISVDPDDALLRMQAAVWELGAREVALVPPAAEAVDLLTDVLARGTGGVAALQVAARLTSYLELRARFG